MMWDGKKVLTFPQDVRTGFHSIRGLSEKIAASDHRKSQGEYIVYRVDMAFVTSRFSASSFFFRSSDAESSISNWAIASLSAVSILSFVPRFSFKDIVGSDTISSTREMYDSSCCLASNFLLKASSLFLNFAASKFYKQGVFGMLSIFAHH